ncbi:MAG: C1 family peptidase [Candidatus Heimdallarchaeota archaeon]
MNQERHWALGWQEDPPDDRDWTPERTEVRNLFRDPIYGLQPQEETYERHVDLLKHFSPIEHQGGLQSCTAHTGVGLLEYFERKTRLFHADASRLFLFYVTRVIVMGRPPDEDKGTDLRATMVAMADHGVAPEELWPYTETEFNERPCDAAWKAAKERQALVYYRLDRPEDLPKSELLNRVKKYIDAGFPSMFGFKIFECAVKDEVWDSGLIPFPRDSSESDKGHAVIALGYDDHKIIASENGKPTEGALLIRNSWGTIWGDQTIRGGRKKDNYKYGGYGWLPYKYVEEGLTRDWWTLIKAEWVETPEFREGFRIPIDPDLLL